LNHNDFYTTTDYWRWRQGFKGTETAQKRAGILKMENRTPSTRFSLFPELKRLNARDPLSPPPPRIRSRRGTGMALAFCLAGASTSIVYKLLR